jgi:hypothetical protein
LFVENFGLGYILSLGVETWKIGKYLYEKMEGKNYGKIIISYV